MYVYITAGTSDYLNRLMEKYPNEKMVVMENLNEALLFHETTGKTVFKQSRRYQTIASRGELSNKGIVVMNHIPITDEGRPLFEHQMKIHNWFLGNETGLSAFRALRPLASNAYIMMTVWEKDTFYQKNDQTSLVEKINTLPGYSQKPSIFESSPYIRQYIIKNNRFLHYKEWS